MPTLAERLIQSSSSSIGFGHTKSAIQSNLISGKKYRYKVKTFGQHVHIKTPNKSHAEIMMMMMIMPDQRQKKAKAKESQSFMSGIESEAYRFCLLIYVGKPNIGSSTSNSNPPLD